MFFEKDAYALLWDIRLNNNKEWFDAHKAAYEELIWEPLKTMGAILQERMAGQDLKLRVTRIYRDVNMAPHTRYRDTFFIYLRGESVWWGSTPSLVFCLAPEGASYGFQIPKPEPKVMEAFRQEVDEFLKLTPDDFVLDGEQYKRPKPCPKEEWLPYFQLRGLTLMKQGEPDPAQIADDFDRLMPVYRFFERLVANVELKKLEERFQQIEPQDEPVIHFEKVHLPEPEF